MKSAQTIAEHQPRALTTATSAHELAQRLRSARERTILLAHDLTGEQLMGPQLAIVNPPLWEIAHLGWFQEYWCLRYRGQEYAAAPSSIAVADSLYDSARVPHSTRWRLPLLPFDEVLRYLDDVLSRVLERLASKPDDTTLRYFAELVAAHEEMHCEAFTYTRQTLSYPAPRSIVSAVATSEPCSGDVAIAGGEYLL